jgi:hypothetical protein
MGLIERRVGDMGLITKLDVSGVEALWTIGYRLTDASDDPWTVRFNQFKYRNIGAVEAGARTLGSAIQSGPLAEVRRGVVVGAISAADERLAADASVRALGQAAAEARSWEWRPDILRKRRHKKLAFIQDAGSRDSEVAEAYTCEPLGGSPGTAIVVDDFCTRGSTMADISRAISAANPAWRVVGVVLGKNESTAWGASNDDVPPRLARIWDGQP